MDAGIFPAPNNQVIIMNKFLMMSAAAVMTTMAAAPSAVAGTSEVTFQLTTSCSGNLFKGKAGTYAGLVSCIGSSYTLQGFPVKGKFGGIRNSLSLSFPFNSSRATTLQLAVPIKRGSKWNMWVSTNGTTGVIVESGRNLSQSPKGERTGPRLLDKLTSILGDRQKQ
jgi:hypothetical protein